MCNLEGIIQHCFQIDVCLLEDERSLNVNPFTLG